MANLLELCDVLDTYKSKKHGVIALSEYNLWFPLKPSAALAGIVGDLMGDGHLQDAPKLRVDYTSKYVCELDRFDKEVSGLFGIHGKIRRCTTNKYNTKNLGINNKPFARVLKLIGVPTGPKVSKSFSIPRWILEDKVLFSRFINRLFSCEACVDVQSKCIELRMYKSLELLEDGISFFNQIKYYLLLYFKIETTNPFLEGRVTVGKYGKMTKGIRIKIKRKDSVTKYYEFVGFEDTRKQERLGKVVLSFSKSNII